MSRNKFFSLCSDPEITPRFFRMGQLFLGRHHLKLNNTKKTERKDEGACHAGRCATLRNAIGNEQIDFLKPGSLVPCASAKGKAILVFLSRAYHIMVRVTGFGCFCSKAQNQSKHLTMPSIHVMSRIHLQRGLKKLATGSITSQSEVGYNLDTQNTAGCESIQSM